ncbi:amino acid adenylation domain-containing protein [Nocardia sp. NPDC050799]|uniref:amino acid adenylation domain-containing protein n=1 Tax=Nocardia sp. NPDC050799 TaxID=3154842 RepID=UPI0033E6C158
MTQAGYVLDCIVQLAEQAPDASALVSDTLDLDRAGLVRRIEIQAGALEAQAATGRYVIVACSDGADQLINVLACHAVGAVPVLVSPLLPSARRDQVLRSELPGSLLITDTWSDEIPSVVDPRLDIREDHGWSLEHRRYPHLHDVAYVIYTSGSTGQPKGVECTHAGLNTLVDALGRAYDLRSTDRVLSIANVSFDVFLEETLPTAAAGGVIVRIDRAELAAKALVAIVEQHRCTAVNIPTAVWLHLVAASERGEVRLPDYARLVVVGSEAVPILAARTWRQVRPPCARTIFAYGLTEATITSSLLEEEELPDPDLDLTHVPLGVCVGDARLHLLDGAMKPVGAGVPGEVFLAGAGVARGYLGRARLTAERFVPDPFGQVPGARLYRTGDRARVLPNGDLEFLGRIDDQVKIRGYRVELGEVEASLAAVPGVTECAVTARDDGRGGRQLVGYYVTDETAARPTTITAHGPADRVDAVYLRAQLTALLPDYAVPSVLIELDGLPLTLNGKIDRSALPAPQDHSYRRAHYVEPATESERLLARIWAETLAVGAVGAQDTFVELGGDSLTAMAVRARIDEMFGVRTDWNDLITGRVTLRSFASRLPAPTAQVNPVLSSKGRSGASTVASFAQERMWFLDRLGAGSAYAVPLAFRVTGAVDMDAVRRAVRAVVDRHHVLRTVLRLDDNQLVSLPGTVDPAELHFSRAAAETEQQRWSWAVRWAQNFSSEPFNLGEGPLCRFGWIELDRDDAVLVMSFHHAVIDGSSLGLLCRDLTSAYANHADATHMRPDSAGLLQYSDFASWQRELLEYSRERDAAYWCRQLEMLPTTELPTDRPRPRVQQFAGRTLRTSIDPDLSRQVLERSSREAVTPFVFLLSAYCAVIAARTGANEVVLGTPVSGRTRREWENLVGLFVNTVVLRTHLHPHAPFRELLTSVKDTVLQALQHQELPFDELVRALDVSRDPSRNPLFGLMFTFLGGQGTDPAGQLALGSSSVTELELDEGAQVDLNLQIWLDTTGSFQMKFIYATALFEHDTIARFADHFITSLRRAVADPAIDVAALQALPDSERELVLRAWNRTTAAVADRTVVDLFRAQVAATPTACAVSTDSSGSLTYAELDGVSEMLSRVLRSRGVGRGSIVGICLGRGSHMVAALLAVLKAGAAYMPLDPDYPIHRLAFMLRDSAAILVVTNSSLRARLPQPWSDDAVDADQFGSTVAPDYTDRARCEPGPSDAAYVIYTSGSTGQPKGVVSNHRALVNRLLWMGDYFGLDSTDVVLQKTSFSFDVSVWEILCPLLVGARLHMARPGGHRDPQYLAQTMVSQRVTTVHFVPAMLRVFLHRRTGQVPTLRRVVCSGEALPTALAAWANSYFGGIVHNLYGPTEAAIDVTAHRCGDFEHDPMPIGRPIWNTTAYVLNRSMDPVGVGVLGELFLGGVAVARGYVGRPGLTAARFVPDPFATSPGARLYRTGDLVRYLSDGSLQFLGRVDDQVKIRGHRVELGEVQTHLAAVPGIAACAVTVHSDSQVGQRLVGYYVVDKHPSEVPAPAAHSGGSVDDRDIRAQLAAVLPDYALPSVLIELESIPLTVNGKIDPAALPAPEGRAHSGIDYLAPSTEDEKLLARIWSEVLHIDAVGTNDNFFALGGDSILIVTVVERAVQAGLNLEVSDMFQHSTLSRLAHATSAGDDRLGNNREASRQRARQRRQARRPRK